MTDVDQVTVTAADREAYLELNTLMPQFSDDIRAGKWDRLTGLQVIARHRIAAARAAIEAAAEASEAIGKKWHRKAQGYRKAGNMGPYLGEPTGYSIATAIRSLALQEPKP